MVDKVSELTRLFERINLGGDPSQVVREATDFLATVEPKDIVTAEKAMLDAGCSISDLRRLYPAEVEILHDQADKLRKSLPANHIVHKLLSEHEMFLCFLADLEDVNRVIRHMDSLSTASAEFRKLARFVRHAVGGLDHMRLEDELIFPELERHGYLGTPQIFTTEHLTIGVCVDKLKELLDSVSNNRIRNLAKFKDDLDEIAKSLVSIGRSHVFKEDNILYPIAVELIDDPKLWGRIRALCDELGYCSMQGRW